MSREVNVHSSRLNAAEDLKRLADYLVLRTSNEIRNDNIEERKSGFRHGLLVDISSGNVEENLLRTVRATPEERIDE